jgi:nicotinamidase-related amidase
MIIPDTGTPKALFVIDVQPRTFVGDVPFHVSKRIARFIGKVAYEAIVVAEFHAPEDSMLYKQHDFLRSEAETGGTEEDILKALRPYKDKVFQVKKTTRSTFKGFNSNELRTFLASKQIGEIHLTGFDIDDCVLATLYDSIDLGYYTFLLEELTHRYDGNPDAFNAALTIFRLSNMTNNSLHRKISHTKINFED